MPATTWNDHVKKCAREWHDMKNGEKAEKARKKDPPPPPKVPKRIRGKQSDSQNDLN